MRKKAIVADFLATLTLNIPGPYDKLRWLFAMLPSQDPLQCEQWEGLASLWLLHSTNLGCKEDFMGEEALLNNLKAFKRGEWPTTTVVAMPRLDLKWTAPPLYEIERGWNWIKMVDTEQILLSLGFQEVRKTMPDEPVHEGPA